MSSRSQLLQTQSSPSECNEFNYVFGEKEDVLLVLFQGGLSGKEVPLLEQCESELKTKSAKIIIFVFRDVPRFIPGAHPTFVRIQKNLRDSGKVIGNCNLSPEVKESLRVNGIVRGSEIYNSIPEAWKELKLRV